MNLKKVTLADLAILQAISQQTFVETFAKDNTPENLQSYLESALNLPRLKEELENPESEFYFLQDTKPVGYLKINVQQAQTENMGEKALQLERLYLLKEMKGQGYGTFLIRQVEELAKAKNKEKIWLGVWEYNEPAKRFYEKLGFTYFSQHVFLLGTDAQTDLLMEKNL